jgi:N-methylhydantoinase A
MGNGGPVTVTDALLLLGRLPLAFMPVAATRLDETLALAALLPLARQAGLSARRCAEGIVELAEASMARALRAMSEERGHDPRDATLVPCGGGGAVHASALARTLGIRSVLVPPHPGAFSAQGLLLAPLVVIRSQTLLRPLRGAEELMKRCIAELQRGARKDLSVAGAAPQRVRCHVSVDLRYAGQSHELELPLSRNIEGAFHQAHQERSGFMDLEREVELVNVRVRAEAHTPAPAPLKLPQARGLKARPVMECKGLLARTAWSVHDRDLLLTGMELTGPTLIADRTATITLLKGDHARVLEDGSILMRMGKRS